MAVRGFVGYGNISELIKEGVDHKTFTRGNGGEGRDKDECQLSDMELADKRCKEIIEENGVQDVKGCHADYEKYKATLLRSIVVMDIGFTNPVHHKSCSSYAKLLDIPPKYIQRVVLEKRGPYKGKIIIRESDYNKLTVFKDTFKDMFEVSMADKVLRKLYYNMIIRNDIITEDKITYGVYTLTNNSLTIDIRKVKNGREKNT